MLNTAMIVNPVSGGGQGLEAQRCLQAIIKQAGDECTSFVTERSGDANRFAHDLSQSSSSSQSASYDAVFVIGGDGTFNEVINGLQDLSVYPLLQIPLGTANMLAQELNQSKDLQTLYSLVQQGRTRALDVVEARGEWGERRFVLLSSVGFDALVTNEVSRTRTGTMGYSAYIKPILRSLCRYRVPHLRITVDDDEQLRGAMVVASNTKNYGGVLSITDLAELGDGMFDVAVFKRGSIPSLLIYTIVAYFGRISAHPWVTYRKARRVKIESDDSAYVQVDGDFIGQVPLELRCLPQPIRVFCDR
ncbi:MAG: diacylglycerol/lipid kinase family protein [Planctomycetota bacterium]|jgi:YegS/Rv2252/BmrU family lipid kinase